MTWKSRAGLGVFILLFIASRARAQWTVAPTVPQPTQAMLTDPAQDKPAALSSIPASFSNGMSNVGGVIVKTTAKRTPTDTAVAFTITNGNLYRLDSIDFRLPELSTPADAANKLMSPFRGGQAQAMEGTDWSKGQGNSSVWPGTAFSPIVTLWNDRTGDTLAIDFFNPRLAPVFLYWFSGPGTGIQCFNPFLRVLQHLEPGESLTVSVKYHVMTGGAVAHAKRYRQLTLLPFMQSLGIPEAASPIGQGPIAMDANGSGTLIAGDIQAASAANAAAFFQWAAPDGLAGYYNPYPPSSDWFAGLATAKQYPKLPVGCLINPFISPRIPADQVAMLAPGQQWVNRHLSIGADDNRQSIAQLRDALASRGVSLAFWDTGSGPDGCTSRQWLSVLWSWKQAGISIMPETSCDVAAWTTGIWMEYPYSWGDYSVAKTVCPKAALAAHTNAVDLRGDWAADAKAKGLHPIVEVGGLK